MKPNQKNQKNKFKNLIDIGIKILLQIKIALII
jgi:hypothetical protein